MICILNEVLVLTLHSAHTHDIRMKNIICTYREIQTMLNCDKKILSE